jgi:uncharacterized protein (TIGR03435 family)
MIPDSLAPIANHLWQSTLFAGVAGLLTLALRKNSARVRHWVWVAASLKFLVPFSVLITLGSYVQWGRVSVPTQTNFSIALDQVSQPFTAPTISAPLLSTAPSPGSMFPAVLWTAWGVGFIGIACSWWIRWKRITAAVRAGSRVQLGLPIEATSSPSFLEPGVFGVFRPVLLLPKGIFEHLTPEQWKTVVAHEMCHVRHRDNLIGIVQMCVETVFWFHPLVWWVGKRIFQERERACDEEVLRLGSEPRTYAQSILKVCEFYLESPVMCVSGVTGSNLKRRIEAILGNPMLVELSFARKAVLATASIAALVGPIGVGIVYAPSLRAQTRPAFEVATVKRNTSGDANSGSRVRPGGISISNMTIKDVLMWAYQIRGFQLSGGPGWIDSEQYDIEAKPPSNTDPQQQILMLQTLLRDRFSLELHRETKMLPVYELTIAKGGMKLKDEGNCISLEPGQKLEQGQKISDTCGYNMLGRGRFDATSTSMGDLAKYLSPVLGRQVVDKTGVSGRFPVHLTFIPDVAAVPDDPGNHGPSIFTAVQEQLGLKLDSAKGPVEVLVIDHVEHPSEN